MKGTTMRRFLVFVLLVFSAAALQAQRIQIDLPASLAAKAVETVDVTLDGPLLRLAARFLDGDREQRVAREMIHRLEGIYVKSYQFDSDGAYDAAVLDKVRGQLGGSWKRLVMVKERHGDHVEIHANMRGEDVIGLVVLAAEPRELTIVNLVGPIDIDKLANLEGHFGIPKTSKQRRNDD
jgi:Domain of unknown function (DUF4252)